MSLSQISEVVGCKSKTKSWDVLLLGDPATSSGVLLSSEISTQKNIKSPDVI